MAKIHVNRVAESLGLSPDEMSGMNYQDLMSEVLDKNTRNIQRAVGRMTNTNYEKQIVNLKKKGRLKEKVVLLPSMEDVFPKRSVAVVKAAESGKLVTQTLADRMNKSLRDTMKSWQASGKPFEVPTGRNAGKIDPRLIQEFEKDITGVFQEYTKRDPSTGVPGNVRQIAITEIRTNIDSIKSEYHKQLERKNAGNIESTKTWKQNRGLSKEPREYHTAVDGVTVLRNSPFLVPNPNGGFDRMMHPHDPTAPPEQTIGCSCDVIYKVVLL